jgi:hypothetical protein
MLKGLLLLPRQGSSACCCILTRRASEGNAPDPSLALFDVALFGLFPEIGIGENGETLRNG